MVDEKVWNNENWVVSEHNFSEEVTKEFNLSKKIQFHDVTLRDGEQSPGLVFRKHEKVAIAKMLDELGVDRIEAGMPAVSQEDAEAIKEITSLGLKAKIMVFSRAMEADINRAVECGVDGVVIEVPSAEIRFVNQFKWTAEQVIDKAVRGITYAKEKGLFVNFFPYDTTRARLPFLERLITTVVKTSPPDSIAVIDTTSTALPGTVKKLIRFMKNLTKLPIEIHTHNDFGLGVANALAGLEAGADVVHGSMVGLGERCGNASLEEIAICLRVLYGANIKLDFSRIYEICTKIAEMANVQIPFNKPFIGFSPFIKESGLGVEVLATKPTTIFALNPKFIGRNFMVGLGKKSGRESVRYMLAERKLEGSDAQVDEILSGIKQKGIEKKALLSTEEFNQILRSVLGKS